MAFDSFYAEAIALGVSDQVACAAWENVTHGRTVFLVMSGKMGSGKDTLAPLVLAALGRKHAYHMYYADALKDEADRIFAVIGASSSPQQAAAAISRDFNISGLHAAELVDAVADELREDPGLHARQRTAGTRRFLQFLGTDVRRSADEDYWVNIALNSVLHKLAEGQDVYATDARFPNEVIKAGALGAFTVRLLISAEVQAQRLLSRDGAMPSAEALTHSSETQLDTFEGFSLVVPNEGPISQACDAIVTGLTKRS